MTKTVETVDILLPAPEACEADTNPGKVAAQVAARKAGKPARKRHQRIASVAEFIEIVKRGVRWASPGDDVIARLSIDRTRDFVREELTARAAEGDSFAVMALRAHGIG